MDNWPAWKMEPKTAAEIEADHAQALAEVRDIRWSPSLGWGLGAGAAFGVVAYFVSVNVLPYFYNAIDIIK